MNGYSGFQTPTPADLEGAEAPSAGAPGYIMRHDNDEAHDGSPDPVFDTLEIYAFSVDWDSPGNSWMIDYSVFTSVPQPGSSTRLDPIREVILNRLIYRNFGDHETLASPRHRKNVGVKKLYGSSISPQWTEGTHPP